MAMFPYRLDQQHGRAQGGQGRLAWEDKAGGFVWCWFHPLFPLQCPPARTREEAVGREGARGAYEFCSPRQGDSSLPRARLALLELPGVTFIPVCRKHVFHGWLHWIIITRRSFDQNNVISIVRSIPPYLSLPPQYIRAASKPRVPSIHLGHTPPRHKISWCVTQCPGKESGEMGRRNGWTCLWHLMCFQPSANVYQPYTHAHKDTHAKNQN